MTVAPRGDVVYPKSGPARQDNRPYIRRAQASPHTGCTPGVRVPRAVRDDAQLRSVDALVYAVLINLDRDGDGQVLVGQSELMGRLGRSRTAGTDALRSSVARLREAGHLRTSRAHFYARIRYILQTRAGHAERWDVVPYSVMEAIARGEINAGALVTWLHIDQALGSRGWTADSATELADARGVCAASVRGHVKALAGLTDVLMVTRRRGGSWMLSRSAAHRPVHRASEQREIAGERLRLVGDSDEQVREEIAGRSAQNSRALEEGLAPECHLAPAPSPSRRSLDRHLSEGANAAAVGLRPKRKSGLPEGGVFARAQVREVIGALHPRWRTSEARRWLGGIASAIASALDVGMAPPAVVAAIEEMGEVQFELAGGRHVVAVRESLRIRWREIGQGLACGRCGVAFDYTGQACERCAVVDLVDSGGRIEGSGGVSVVALERGLVVHGAETDVVGRRVGGEPGTEVVPPAEEGAGGVGPSPELGADAVTVLCSWRVPGRIALLRCGMCSSGDRCFGRRGWRVFGCSWRGGLCIGSGGSWVFDPVAANEWCVGGVSSTLFSHGAHQLSLAVRRRVDEGVVGEVGTGDLEGDVSLSGGSHGAKGSLFFAAQGLGGLVCATCSWASRRRALRIGSIKTVRRMSVFRVMCRSGTEKAAARSTPAMSIAAVA